jgi:uncharacterized Zn finger protein
MHCSCPDWEVPCKHLAAVCYVLAEAFDEDPFALLAWRGKGKDELLGALRRTGGGSGGGGVGVAGGGSGDDAVTGEDGSVSATREILADVSGAPLSASAGADFWSAGLSVARLRSLATPPASSTTPDLLLRMFEPPEVKIRNKDLRTILTPAYEALTSSPEDS